MGKQQHTPGPWTLSSAREIRSPKNNMIASVWGTTIDAVEAWANGRLIASAPCLLASLREQLAAQGIDPDGSPEGYSEPVQRALAALRKAEGGPTP